MKTHQAVATLERGMASVHCLGAVFRASTIQLGLTVKHKPCILHPQKVTPSILETPGNSEIHHPFRTGSFFLSLLQLVSGSSRTWPRCSTSQDAYPDPTPISIPDPPHPHLKLLLAQFSPHYTNLYIHLPQD